MSQETRAGIVAVLFIAALVGFLIFLRGGADIRDRGYEIHVVVANAGGIAVDCAVPGRLRLHGRVGDRVSLLPLSQEARGVRTTGLRYALHGETLQAYRSRGISNEMIAPVAEVALDSGLLVCIHSRRQAIPSTLPVEGVSS